MLDLYASGSGTSVVKDAINCAINGAPRLGTRCAIKKMCDFEIIQKALVEH